MKISKLMGVLVAVVFFLFSCSSQPDVTESILITVPESQQESAWIKNNLVLDRIVQIETTAEHVLGYVKRIILYKDKFIILDGQQPCILVVNAYTGKVETNINRKGRGPGESSTILDIAFDEKKEQILVFNDYKKLIFFSLEGKFLKEENIDGFYENISYDNGNILFYKVSAQEYSFPHTISVYNPDKKSWKKLGEEKKVDFPPIRGYGRILVKSKIYGFHHYLALP